MMVSFVLPLMLSTTTVGVTTAATSEVPQHCVTFLEPMGPGPVPGEVVAKPVPMGCFQTYAEALLVGSGGSTRLPAGIGPADLTQSILDHATAETDLTSYLLGTEFVDTGFGGTSNSYYGDGDCVGETWAVSWLGDAWNDRFESGRGFSNCDHNKKFENADFGGAVLTCTPNCNNYGALNNEISSLRWRD